MPCCCETKDLDWVTSVIAKMEGAVNGVLDFEVDGVKVSAVLGPPTIAFFKDNKTLLLRIGKSAFTNFLILIHQKKIEEAFDILLSQMDADNIIARMNMNALQLKQDNDDHDSFVKALKKFAMDTLTSAGTKILIGLITAAF